MVSFRLSYLTLHIKTAYSNQIVFYFIIHQFADILKYSTPKPNHVVLLLFKIKKRNTGMVYRYCYYSTLQYSVCSLDSIRSFTTLAAISKFENSFNKCRCASQPTQPARLSSVSIISTLFVNGRVSCRKRSNKKQKQTTTTKQKPLANIARWKSIRRPNNKNINYLFNV